MGFSKLIELIKRGESVASGVVNRPLAELFENEEYLYELIKAAFLGSTVFARQVTVETDANVGQPVYFNSANQRFERGLAGVTSDISTGQFMTAESAQVWGVVYSKTNATLGDILLFGFAELDISQGLEDGEALKAGLYYLSRTTPGKMIARRPPIAVPVLRADGEGKVFVNAQWDDLIDHHSHFHFKLKPVPAGHHVAPGVGNIHTIASPNVHVEGWLPASHAIFAGKAPHDAKFGYNLSVSALKRIWPPLPPESAVLYQDGILVPSGPAGEGKVQFTRDGIWWMSNCYADVPFPSNVSTDFDAVSESSEFSETPTQCPFPYEMMLDLYFSQVGFLTDSTVVTSLSTDDKRIRIFCEGKPDQSARIGPLQLALDLEFMVDDDDPGGFLAFKGFDADKQLFKRGPVATGLWTPNAGITLTGDGHRTETIDGLPRTVFHGRVGVDIDSGFNREVRAELVRLDGVQEEFVLGTMYLEFPSQELANIRVRISVPESLGLNSPKLRLRFRMLGRATGTLPQLTVAGRRIPKPSGATDLPTTDATIVISTAVTLTAANQYVDVISSAIAVAEGDDFMFTIERSASDTYLAALGIISIIGLLSAA